MDVIVVYGITTAHVCDSTRRVRVAVRGLINILVWVCTDRVAMVKPEKAKRVEEMLMHAAKSGALGGKVTEDQFIQMLEQVRNNR